MDHGIPLYSRLVDGNQSDKTINRNLIPEMVKRMRTLGRETFIYVADSALVTGWEKRQTSRSTSLMLTTKFVGGFVLVSTFRKQLGKPLTPVQLRYLEILDLTSEIFLQPFKTQHDSIQRE